MAKATNVPGGLGDQLSRNANKAPGPGYYFKDFGEKAFVNDAMGGTFSKLTRDTGKKPDKEPAVGQYETQNAQTTPRTKGGLMCKRDRVCAFARIAEKAAWQSGPGKYDAQVPDKHRGCPSFQSKNTESRVPRKGSQVGPGYYNPNYMHTDFKPPAYSGSKEESGTYMNRMVKDKAALPFPWYKDMPDSVMHDRIGARKHAKTLLADRVVTPRGFPQRQGKDRASTPRGYPQRQEKDRASTPRGYPHRQESSRRSATPG